MAIEEKTITLSKRDFPTGLEIDYLAAILENQFIRRWDLFSKQQDDGRFLCIHERLQHDHLLEHLQGEITLGTYVLDEDSFGRFLIFDADDAQDWRRLQALARVLREFKTPTYLERSRRGGHLWIFFGQPLSGAEIRRFGQGLMFHFGLGSMELFPKQDYLVGGPGSLIRLPFGVHRKSGRRYGFYDLNHQPLAPLLREQIYLFENPETVPAVVIEQFANKVPTRNHQRTKTNGTDRLESEVESQPPLYEQIKRVVSVRDFVSQFVELSSSGSGLCPFHNDHVESFSVNEKQNYWKCFACDKSGSIIDFWMYYRDCDFKTATTQLSEMLL